MLRIRIAEERPLPYYGIQSRFLDLNNIEDIHILMYLLNSHSDFKITHIKGIRKKEDGTYGIDKLVFEAVKVVNLNHDN